MGRLTRDPEVRYTQKEDALAIARYTLAVDRRFQKNTDQTADFIPCVCFGKLAEFAEKWLKQGVKIYINVESDVIETTIPTIQQKEA